jgi:hypothetical protein
MYLPCNGGYVQALGNLVYTRPDGTHGNNQFAFYTVSPQGKVTAKTPWEPPQYGGRTHTTSYHHPIMYALADGRMFLRQYDGIYCYDLRATAAAKKVGQAVQTAGEDPVRVREALCALSLDADPAVREEAVRILVRHVTTTKAVKPTPALLQVLTSAVGGDNAKNEMVSQALAVFGAESVPVVAGLAKEQDPVRRLFAMQTLARLKDVSGATVDELLRTGIGDKVLAVSEAALKAVEVRGASAASFVPELIRWVDEEPPTRGVAAARALLAVQPVGGKPDPLPKTYEAKLVELMAVWQEDDMLNRVLGAIRGLGDEAALRIAVDVLENSDALRGIRACHVLGGLGPKAASAIPALESAKKKWGGRGFVNAANGALKQITPGK